MHTSHSVAYHNYYIQIKILNYYNLITTLSQCCDKVVSVTTLKLYTAYSIKLLDINCACDVFIPPVILYMIIIIIDAIPRADTLDGLVSKVLSSFNGHLSYFLNGLTLEHFARKLYDCNIITDDVLYGRNYMMK